MVRIRMKRMGRRHRPFYRINAVELRTKRDGKVLEPLGWFDPIASDEAKQVNLNEERVRYWLSVGAQPSDTVMDMLAKRGIVDADAWNATKARRIEKKLAEQAAAKAAAEEEAKRQAEEEAKKQAAEAEAKAKAEAEPAAAESGDEGGEKTES